MRCGSRPAVSAGREVLGEQDGGLGRLGHTGCGQSGEFGDDPVADVLEIGDPLGHQAAHLGEHLDELRSRIGRRADRRFAAFDGVLRRSQPGPVGGQLSGRGQNLGRARYCRGPFSQTLGDAGGGPPKRATSAGRSASATLTAGIQFVNGGQPVGPDNGREPDTRNHGDALQCGRL